MFMLRFVTLIHHHVPGPNRSTLQAMLKNLGDADNLSSSPAGAASSSLTQNSMPDFDDIGMHE